MGYLMYLSPGNVPLESEMGHIVTFEILVHLTWNDPIMTSIKMLKPRWICLFMALKLCRCNFLSINKGSYKG